jgi:hypothetical protein
MGLLGVPKTADSRRLMSLFAQILAVLVVMTALNPWSWALPTLLLLAGVAMTISNISANTVVQSTVATHTLGRTVSLHMLAIRGGGALRRAHHRSGSQHARRPASAPAERIDCRGMSGRVGPPRFPHRQCRRDPLHDTFERNAFGIVGAEAATTVRMSRGPQ